MSGFVPYAVRKQYLLSDLPAPLRSALKDETQRRNTSLANIACEILAAPYGIAYEPSDRALKNDFIGGVSILLRLPPEVMNAIRDEADERSIAMRSVMLLALCAHFGLEPPHITKVDPLRRPGRKPKHGRPRGRKA